MVEGRKKEVVKEGKSRNVRGCVYRRPVALREAVEPYPIGPPI